MKKNIAPGIALFLIALAAPALVLASAPASKCEDADKDCKEFERLIVAQQPDQLIARYEAARTVRYSDASRGFIGQAYLALTSRDGIGPETEEAYYRKALGVGYSIAYMGLYFFTVQKDEEKALGYLREYVKTKPADPVPYALLGEAELNRRNYLLADAYLKDARRLAHTESANLDWMLFQVNYLLQNYTYASEMLESALKKGRLEQELRALVIDTRFENIGKRPEFAGYQALLKPPAALSVTPPAKAATSR